MANKLSFILYQDHESPKYYEIKRSFLKFLVFVFPFLTLISLTAAVMLLIYFKDIKDSFAEREPQIFQELKAKNKTLKDQNSKVIELNKQLIEKLGQTSTQSSNLSAELGLFHTPAGQQDFTQNPKASIANVDVGFTNNQVSLSFNLINEKREQGRLRGYLFVILKLGGNLYFYPNNSMPGPDFMVRYTKGEVFSMNTLRPTKATFATQAKSQLAIFKILIFSQTGDLLHKKIISQQLSTSEEQ